MLAREGRVAPDLGPLRHVPWPDIRRQSQLKKCMIFDMPPGMRPPAVSPAAMPLGPVQPVPRPYQHLVPQVPQEPQRRPANDVRFFPAVSPADVHAARRHALHQEERNKLLGKVPAARAWYDDPVALGTALIFFPPIGLAALWSSKRYSSDARWALTLMTALTLCLGAVVTIVVLALRH